MIPYSLATTISTTMPQMNQQWKQAAAEEAVDYAAVAKMFHDQAYGFVANKAKTLFQEPFRLGFEIVHRNEKATRMYGVFAFRVNGNLVYIPVFFLHGEIKPTDMMYRTEKKMFTFLDDAWCKRIVNGAQEESGVEVPRGGHRQRDANFHRLAYPEITKYASYTPEDKAYLEKAAATDKQRGEFTQEKAAAAWNEMLTHAAEVYPKEPKLLPRFLKSNGAPALEKLAGWIDESPLVERFIAENYTMDELLQEPDIEKAASSPEEFVGVAIIRDITQVKNASARALVADRGYYIHDNRPKETTNVIIEHIDDSSVFQVTGNGRYDFITSTDGGNARGQAMTEDRDWIRWDAELGDYRLKCRSDRNSSKPDLVYLPETKELLDVGADIFGSECGCEDDLGIPFGEIETDKHYVMFDPNTGNASQVFKAANIVTQGHAKLIFPELSHGETLQPLTYSKNVEKCCVKSLLVNDDMRLLEVVTKPGKHGGWEPKRDTIFVKGSELDQRLRTADDMVKSASDINVVLERGTGFLSVREKNAHTWSVSPPKSELRVIIDLCKDFDLRAEDAEALVKRASDRGEASGRVFHTKTAGVTRLDSEPDWYEGYDSDLGVITDTPQKRVLSTSTPEVPMQNVHFGDHYARIKNENSIQGELNLPADAVMNLPPEELARMAQAQGVSEIFDHSATIQMAEGRFAVADQIRDYIPDMEKGVDRYCRTLFLLRYRPEEVESEYGRDALQDMENDYQELVRSAGECLLRTIQRFDDDRTSKA